MTDKFSEDIDSYTFGEVISFAKKYIKHKNLQIDYYNSDHGKEIYRVNARKYYYNNREKCCKKARERYAKKMKELGKKIGKRGRPSKIKT
jgi:coenzyme F420-reducing hydrogenase alpha subunit